MARQQETVEEEELEQQYPEKRQTRIDAVRKQGEQQLRKVISYLRCSCFVFCSVDFFRCVNKS